MSISQPLDEVDQSNHSVFNHTPFIEPHRASPSELAPTPTGVLRLLAL